MEISYIDRILSFLLDSKTRGRILPFILVTAFLVRIFICFGANLSHTIVDSDEYFQQADELLKGGYINYFPNGYPFIIAFTKLISSSSAVNLLLFLNVLLGTCSVYFVYSISKNIFQNTGIALLAALLLAIFPTQINYTRWLLTEVPSTFFLLGFYAFYLKKKYLLAGLLAGLAVVIRTELLAIFFLVVIADLILSKSVRWKLLAGLAIPILIVGFYAYKKTGNFSLSGHERINIMYSITSSGGYVDWYFQDKHPEITTTGQAVELYVDYMKKDPITYIKNRLANLWELWGFFPSSSDGERSIVSRLLIGSINFFLLFFGFCGLYKNYKKENVIKLIFPFLVVTGVHTILLALPRYTFTAEPFLLILASYCCWILLTKLIVIKSPDSENTSP